MTMILSYSGTIAQLLYPEKHQLDFARIVGELHALLVRFVGPDFIFEWDCNEIAVFDLPSTRITLGWDVRPGKSYSACLTVSVGSETKLPPPPLGSGHQEMCSRLVEQLHRQFPAVAILWHEADVQLTADLIDRLAGELPQLFAFEKPQRVADAGPQELPRSRAAKWVTKAASELVARQSGKSLHGPQGWWRSWREFESNSAQSSTS